MTRRLSLIVNPASGGGRARKALPAVERELERLGLPFHSTFTTSLTHGRTLAQRAADEGEVAVTFSGDGLLGAVAGVLRGHPDAVIGILPGGRGNDFARVCGIPLDPVEACSVLKDGTPTPLDVGDVGGRTFVGIASLGFDSDANRIANEAPPWLGNLVYAYGALKALAHWRPATFEVVSDGHPRTFTGWSVAAANSKAYGGGMYLAPGAELDDGALDLVTSARTSKLKFLATLPRVFKGTHVEEPSVDVRKAAEIRVSADRPFVVYADGDPIGELPVTIKSVRHAITVLLPS